MIPQGWTTKRLGEIALLSSAPTKKQAGSKFVIVDMGSVSREGSLLTHKRTDSSADLLQVDNLVMPKDDIGGGNIIGRAVHIESNEKYVLGDHVYKLEIFDGHAPYVRYAINSHSVNTALRAKAVGTAQLGLGRQSVLCQAILFPPDSEQRKIAEALTDASSLVESLNALISKKRDMKQAATQHLFSGRTRLSGRSQPWARRPIGALATIEKGSQLGRADMDSTAGTPVWNGGVEPSGFTSTPNITRPVVTVSEGGNSCGWVGRPDGDFWLGGHCYALDPHKFHFSVAFLYHLLKAAEPEIMGLRVGSGLPNIQKRSLREFEVLVPLDFTEAEVLADFFDAMDAELGALLAGRDKAELVKQGMMQELLSGRVRLT